MLIFPLQNHYFVLRFLVIFKFILLKMVSLNVNRWRYRFIFTDDVIHKR